jgi:hypothetical protein
MIIKTGKQLMVETYKNYNIISGTVDNKNPKSLYLNISAWGDPINESIENYANVINHINKKIKSELFNKLDPTLFQVNRTIVDFDMRESGIEYGKRSYMNCEITLFQNNSFKLQEKIIQENIDRILNDVINNVLNDNPYFKFYKKKK